MLMKLSIATKISLVAMSYSVYYYRHLFEPNALESDDVLTGVVWSQISVSPVEYIIFISLQTFPTFFYP